MNNTGHAVRRRPSYPFAVILGTNEIASAVAVHLHRAGGFVILSHDPLPPVIRRKMAFHDTLFEDAATVEGIAAERADAASDIRAGLDHPPGIMITELGLLDLIVIRTLDLLVDARMQKYQVKPDLRWLAGFTVGLGPGFCGGVNCDIAIETRPGKAGQLVERGPTDPPDGMAQPLGDRASERFGRAATSGRWHTAIEIGTRVFKDFIVGHLDGEPVRAPFDGILRGVVRDGTEVPAGAKLLEIDPRGRKAKWTGIDARGRSIAKGVMKALSIREAETAARTKGTLHLVK